MEVSAGDESISKERDFHFPFKPYKIQSEFMSALYSVIEEKRIGIFESPTGTGKSLSILCAALTWLSDYERSSVIALEQEIHQLSSEVNSTSGEANRDWISDQYENIQKKKFLSQKKNQLDLIQKQMKNITKIRMRKKNIKQKKCNNPLGNANNNIMEAEVEKLDEIDDLLLKEQNDDELPDENDEKEEKYEGTKIFFCSRTHSQLKQIVNEIKKTVFKNQTRSISLSSRQQYCINHSVKQLNSNSLINERCLELQKVKTKVTVVDDDSRAVKKQKQLAKCPYYNQNAVENLKNESLTDIMDIEDLVKIAKVQKACPYYSSRLAIPDAQIIMVPYQIMLHKSTREQSGIHLAGNVVIIDEAHNLLDTIANIHSSEVSLDILVRAKQQILSYKQHYFSKFSATILLKINQFAFVLSRLIKILNVSSVSVPRMLFSHELLSEAELFNMNFFDIVKFCLDTKFAQKVHGFAQKKPLLEVPNIKASGVQGLLAKIQNLGSKSKTLPESANILENEQQPEDRLKPNAILPVISFLQCLMENFEDGRILLTYSDDAQKSTIKYLLLNPGARFNDLVNGSRSLILAGGTMQPISEFTEQLFKSCQDRVVSHCFDHIVPNNAILALAVSKGPMGHTFLHNYANRDNPAMMKELASTIQNICNVVPSGVICFFTSYENLMNFHKYLTNNLLLHNLDKKKRIFIEPRGSDSIDKILMEYSRAAKADKAFLTNASQNGALMLSVVGGKLSEGLNFSDELGRCVIIVGLPYPNKFNPELAEKIKFLDSTFSNGAGNEYYENLCMKAVNQCIGRAVRHINDYASVILLDSRFTQINTIKKLPPWISRQLNCTSSYGQVQASLVKFFKLKLS